MKGALNGHAGGRRGLGDPFSAEQQWLHLSLPTERGAIKTFGNRCHPAPRLIRGARSGWPDPVPPARRQKSATSPPVGAGSLPPACAPRFSLAEGRPTARSTQRAAAGAAGWKRRQGPLCLGKQPLHSLGSVFSSPSVCLCLTFCTHSSAPSVNMKFPSQAFGKKTVGQMLWDP